MPAAALFALHLLAFATAPASLQEEDPPLLTEEETLALYRPQLRDRDPAVRRAALAELGRCAARHPEAASSELAKAIARGLKDRDCSVKAEAARQLGQPGLAADDAVPALAKAVPDVQREIVRLKKDSGKGSPSVSTIQREGRTVPAGPAGELQLYAEAVLEALGRYPDPRSAKALAAFVRTSFEDTSGPLLETGVAALLRLGTRSAVGAAIDTLERLDRQQRRNGRQRGAGEDEESPPGGVRVSSSMRGEEVFRLQFPAPDARTLDAMHEQLLALAEPLGGEPPPDVPSGRGWSAWLKAQRERLPDRQP